MKQQQQWNGDCGDDNYGDDDEDDDDDDDKTKVT
jgi:hypothetical protein